MKKIFFAAVTITATGCNKCQECYLHEEHNGIVIETGIGKFCGDEIDEKENEQIICPQGDCYYECQ